MLAIAGLISGAVVYVQGSYYYNLLYTFQALFVGIPTRPNFWARMVGASVTKVAVVFRLSQGTVSKIIKHIVELKTSSY